MSDGLHQPVADRQVQTVTGPVAPLRKAMATALRVSKKHLPDPIERALTDIENGVGRYAWAFDLKADAAWVVRFSTSDRHRPYPDPESVFEAGYDVLHGLFPGPRRRVMRVEGEQILRHPHINPIGAGAMITKVPRAIPRAQWLSSFGFGAGALWLVRCSDA